MKRSCQKKAAVSLLCGLLACSAVLLPACSRSSSEQNIVTAAELPGETMQASISFPDWDGKTEPSLAVNALYSFTGFSGQGELYITPSADVTGFTLYVNSQRIPTDQMPGGSTWKVDISSMAVNGANTLQLTDIMPADLSNAVRVDIAYPTVIPGTPEDVGVDPAVFDDISSIIQADVDHGFPGAQLAVIKDGRMIYQNAWGTVNAYEQDGSPKTGSPAVTNDTLFDLASVTKMYSVNYVLQYLVSRGRIDLDARVTDLMGAAFADDTLDISHGGSGDADLDTIRRWKSEITVRDLLLHQAGFPADPRYADSQFSQSTYTEEEPGANVLYSGSSGSAEDRAKTLESIFRTPLSYEPRTRTVYSDVDYILLDFIIEKTAGSRLDQLLEDLYLKPMGLTHITYNPLQNGFSRVDCAATELNGNTRDGHVSFPGIRTETIQGEVHDENAYYAMGGISGHAGLFASASDLARLSMVMLTGGYGTHQFFSKDVLDAFTSPRSADAAYWGLGWWRQADLARVKYFGTQSSRDTIGFEGWTGTLAMIDPQENLIIVFLTNKRNTRITDPETSLDQCDGSWYTTASLGFVPQLLYQALDSRGGYSSQASCSLISGMLEAEMRTVSSTEGLTADHPLVKAARSIAEVLAAKAKACGSQDDAERARQAEEQLDQIQ